MNLKTFVHSYTMESSFYRDLNQSLRNRNRIELKTVFFPALKLLLHALNKLPRLSTTVCASSIAAILRDISTGIQRSKEASIHRIFGSTGDRPGYCLVRDTETALPCVACEISLDCRWPFTSTTHALSVLENDMFCGNSGNRTVFRIAVSYGIDISAFSSVSSEKEARELFLE